ncbi:hypothetical protein LLG10_08600 [bacterium]|nr:hypothetical protein [bacterium]
MRKSVVSHFRKMLVFWLVFILSITWIASNSTFGTESDFQGGRKGFSYEYVYINTSDWSAMMVDLENGNYLLSQQTTWIPGTRYSLSVDLTYNAFHSTASSPFGLGWSSIVTEKIISETNPSQKRYIDSTGAEWVFVWNEITGTYDIPKGTQFYLKQLTDGSYSLQTPDQKDRRFDSSGKLIQWRECEKIMVVFQYDEAGRLVRIQDSLSQRGITIHYAEDGKITSITDNMNQSWEFQYNAERTLLLSIKKPDGQSMSLQYTNNLLTTVSDFIGKNYGITYYSGEVPAKVASISLSDTQTYTFTYAEIDQNNKKTTMTDPNNVVFDYYFQKNLNHLVKVSTVLNTITHQIEFVYNSMGLIEKILNSTGDFIQYEYNASHMLTRIVYPHAIDIDPYEIVKVYDPSTNLLLEVREKINTIPTWAVTYYEYLDMDVPCLPSQIIDPLGTITTYDFDENHLLTSIVTGTGSYAENRVKTMEYSYESNGNRQKSTDPEGNETTYQYNQNGFEVSKTTFEGSSIMNNPVSLVNYNYNANNQLTDQSDSLNSFSESITYDQNGFALSLIKSSGCSSSRTVAYSSVISLKPIVDFRNQGTCGMFPIQGTLNQFIQPNAITLAGSTNTTLSDYSPLVATSTNSLQHMTTYTYSLNGNLVKEKNYLDLETNYQIDGLGRITQITNPTNHSITYQYNANSRLTSSNDSLQGVTLYTYNPIGDKIASQDPIQGFLSFQYNLKGNLLSDHQGFYTIDLLGRKTAATYFTGQTDQWEYSREGYILSKNGVGKPRNLLGQTTSFKNETGGFATLSLQKSTGLIQSWIGTGDITSMQFSYLNHSWLMHLTDIPKQLSFQYAWTPYGFLSAQLYPNQTETTYTDTNKMLDSVVTKKGTQIYLQSDPVYNQNDMLTSESDTLSVDGNPLSYSSTLTRDALERIQGIQYQDSQSVQYTYQNNSPLLTSIQATGQNTYEITRDIQSRIQQIRYPNSTTEVYTYNNSMNHIAGIQYPNGSSLSFTWNDLDKITQIVGIENNQLLVLSMIHDSEGRIKKLTKVVQGMEAENWTFSYHPTGIDKAVRTLNGVQNLSLDFTTDLYGRVLSATYSETNGFQGEIYYHTNALGNTTLLTNQQGQPIAGWLYRLHNGQVTASYNPMQINPLFGFQADQQWMTFSLLTSGPTLSLNLQGEAQITNSYGFLDLQTAELFVTKTTGILKNGSSIGICADDCESSGKVRCCAEYRNRYECERSCNDKPARENKNDPNGVSMEDCIYKCMSTCVKWSCCDKGKLA